MYPCNAKQLGDAWEVSLKEGAHPSTGKGMLFALGTGNGTKPYLNPLEAGLVRVSASSMLENSLTKLVEYPVSKAPYTETEEGAGEWISVEFLRHEVEVHEWTFAYPFLENSDHIPMNFRLEGSLDGNFWTTISSHAHDPSLIAWPHVARWSLDAPEKSKTGNDHVTLAREKSFFRYVRVIITGPTFPTYSHFLVCAGLEFFGVMRQNQSAVVSVPQNDVIRTPPRIIIPFSIEDLEIIQQQRRSPIAERMAEVTPLSEEIEIERHSSATEVPVKQFLKGASESKDEQNKAESVIVLLSTFATGSKSQIINSERALNLFQIKNVPCTTIDGADPDKKGKRDMLFAVSKVKGNYPQIFSKTYGGTYEYLGGLGELQDLIDSDDIPYELLQSNPEIKTFERSFSHLRVPLY